MTSTELNTVKFYDNGGATTDRYTAVFTGEHNARNGMCACLGMGERPFHPQGICMHGECQDGPHLGAEIRFSDLPADCQRAVLQDCGITA